MSDAPVAPPESTSAARLNPFVFPSDTTFRFALLVVAVLGANLYVWNWLWHALGSDGQAVAAGYEFCVRTYGTSGDIEGVDPVVFGAANDAFTACVQEVNQPLAWWMIGGTALLLAVATLILLALPRWITYRRGLRPLTREEAPAVVDELSELSSEAGLAEEPRWLWNPLDPSPTGLAFGRPGSHAVALMGGLVVRQIADPPAFRSVVRHELAHLRNRDVDLTYATVSLWYAFLLASVLPFAFVVADEGVRTVLALGWRLLALAALVYLTRNAVLRAREVYADVRASVPDRRDGALRRILAALPRLYDSWWGRLRSVHPDPETRLAALEDTRTMFPIGLLVAFGTGVAATIAYESLVTFIGIFLSDSFSIYLLSAAVFAPLALGVVGVGVWRGVWATLADDRPRSHTWPLALAFAAGFLVGPELALQRGIRLEGDETLLETALGGGALWIAVLALSFVLLLAWIRRIGDGMDSRAGGSHRALPGRQASASCSQAACWQRSSPSSPTDATPDPCSASTPLLDYAPASEAAWVGPTWLWELVEDAWLLVLLQKPAIIALLVALWLFPLTAWLRRRHEATDAPWAFLEPGGHLRLRPLGRPSLEPWRIGILVGLACLVAFAVLRLGLRAGVDAEARAELGFSYAFFYWQLLLALAAQACAGVLAAARMRELPLVGALAAAFTVGAVATAGIVVGPSLAGCIDPIAMSPGPCAWEVDASFTWLVFRQVVAEGAIAALAGGLVVLGVRALLARRHAPVPAGVPG